MNIKAGISNIRKGLIHFNQLTLICNTWGANIKAGIKESFKQQSKNKFRKKYFEMKSS